MYVIFLQWCTHGVNLFLVSPKGLFAASAPNFTSGEVLGCFLFGRNLCAWGFGAVVFFIVFCVSFVVEKFGGVAQSLSCNVTHPCCDNTSHV